jgi:hypothetical protein
MYRMEDIVPQLLMFQMMEQSIPHTALICVMEHGVLEATLIILERIQCP